MTGYTRIFVLASMAALTAAAALPTAAASQAPKDPYPNGCVDCHVAAKAGDMRISTLMGVWTAAVPAALLEKAKAASISAAKIKGKHPAMANVKANVPQTCMAACHKKGSAIAPPFAQLMHTVHLVGGGQNKFVTAYQGDCVHCHKLDQKSGTWKMPTAAEK